MCMCVVLLFFLATSYHCKSYIEYKYTFIFVFEGEQVCIMTTIVPHDYVVILYINLIFLSYSY